MRRLPALVAALLLATGIPPSAGAPNPQVVDKKKADAVAWDFHSTAQDIDRQGEYEAQTDSFAFSCQGDALRPMLFAMTFSPSRLFPLISFGQSLNLVRSRWSSCRDAARHLNALASKKQEAFYLTTGHSNGLPALCASKSRGGPCQEMVLELKQDASGVLSLLTLFGIRQAFGTGPLCEGGGRPYISIADISRIAGGEEVGLASGFCGYKGVSGGWRNLWISK